MKSFTDSTFKGSQVNQINAKGATTKNRLVSSIDNIITSIEDLNRKISTKKTAYLDFNKHNSLLRSMPEFNSISNAISAQFTSQFNLTDSQNGLKEQLLQQINSTSKERLASYTILLNQLKESMSLNTERLKRHRQFITHSENFNETFPLERELNTHRSNIKGERDLPTELKLKEEILNIDKELERIGLQPKLKAAPKEAQQVLTETKEEKDDQDQMKVIKTKKKQIRTAKGKTHKEEPSVKNSKDSKREEEPIKIEKSNKQGTRRQQIDLSSLNDLGTDLSNQVLTARYNHKHASSFDVRSPNKTHQSHSLNGQVRTNEKGNLQISRNDLTIASINHVKAKNRLKAPNESKPPTSNIQINPSKSQKEFYYDISRGRDLGCKCEVGLCTII